MKGVKEFFRTENQKNLKNMAIIAHVDHGKSTLTDNLLAQVGMINKELAGSQLATDCFQVEKERGITINTTNVSFLYKDYLFNVGDTPGHADFSSEVSKTLRGCDGAVLLVDVIEGVMTQTETVLAQAINEGLSIVLFINKVDRVVNELYLNSQQILDKLLKTVKSINTLIHKLTGVEGYFSFSKNIAYGSALNNWALTMDVLKNSGYNFTQVLEMIQKKEPLKDLFPLAPVLLDKCVEIIPSPDKNQSRKISKAHQVMGLVDETPTMVKDSDPKGPFSAIVTDVNYDPYAGLLASVRVLSGKYRVGEALYLSKDGLPTVTKGPTRIMVVNIKKYDDVPLCFPGCQVIFQGCELEVGQTISGEPLSWEYPSLKYARSPVIAYAIAPVKPSESKKMMDSVKNLVLEDPTLKFQYSDETKEFKVYGVGVLHLEVTLKKLELVYGVKVIASNPIIEYAENIRCTTENVSARTSNKHNDFDFYLYKLPEPLVEKLLRNQITNKNLRVECQEHGVPKELAKKAERILENGNIYFDSTKGCSFMMDTRDNIVKGIDLALNKGVKLNKPLKGVGFVITFARIHMDALHRGIIQLRGAFRDGVVQTLTKTPPMIVEPLVAVDIQTPYRYVASLSSHITSKRGQIQEMVQAQIENYVILKSICPLAQAIDMPSQIMSLTEGRGVLEMTPKGYAEIPEDQIKKIS